MSSSTVDICNSALIKIGVKPIMSLDERTASSNLCKLRFPGSKEYVLREHDWSCALKKAQLPALEEENETEERRFTLPSDCLRVVDFVGVKNKIIRGREIISEGNFLEIIYVSNVEDLTKLDSHLREAISCYLAWDLCFRIVQDEKIEHKLWQRYRETLLKARSIDVRESQNPVVRSGGWSEQ